MRSPILDLIAANHTPSKVAATDKRADSGDSFSLFLKDNAAADERRSRASPQRQEARLTEARERPPAVDRRERDSKGLAEAENAHRRSEELAREKPAADSEVAAAFEQPVAITDDRAETAQATDDLDASPVETNDPKAAATPVDPTFGAALALVGAPTQAPAIDTKTVGMAAVRATAVTEADRTAQSVQPAKTVTPVPQVPTPDSGSAAIPTAAQQDAMVQAKAPMAVTVANQDPFSKPAAAPVIEEAQAIPSEPGKSVAMPPATTAKVASDVVAGSPMASIPVSQAIAGQGKPATAEMPRSDVRNQTRVDTAPVEAGSDDSTTPTQTARAVPAPASAGLERNGVPRQDAHDGSGSLRAKPFASEPPITVGHSPIAASGFVQALERAQPHANLGLAASGLDPSEQIAVQVQRALGAGSDRISIHLHPAELGRIEVKLDMSGDNTLRVAVSVDKPETLDLLQRDARSLDRALQDAGIKTDSGSLSFDLRQQADNRHLGRHQPAQTLAFDSPDNDRERSTPALPANQRQTWHVGNVDLHV
ncbi:MAG: flagellar hook-length control protein FliK [Kiloniellales bacterium]